MPRKNRYLHKKQINKRRIASLSEAESIKEKKKYRQTHCTIKNNEEGKTLYLNFLHLKDTQKQFKKLFLE